MSEQKKPLINAQTHTLANGMKVVIIPNGVAPVVTVGIIYHVGTADDPVDQIGLSHFLEHMMFKGTSSIPGAEFNKKILEKGGHNNALTSYDYTLYHTTIAKKHLEFILVAEADRMRNLAFKEHEVVSEKKVVLEERLMRLENNPFGAAYEAYLNAMHTYHPYGVPPIGYPHHINAYSFASARKHYDTYYHPNNATLIITGKITLEEALPIIMREFGRYAKQELPKRFRTTNPNRDGVTSRITQYNKRNSAIILQYSYDAPQCHSENGKKYYYPLVVLSHLLGGTHITHFHKTLVEEKGLALHAAADYDGTSIDPRDFSISATLEPGADIKKFETEMFAILRKIQTEGVSADDLAITKSDLISHLAYIKDGTENLMQTIADNLSVGITIDELNQWQSRVSDVTNDDIKKAATFILGKDPAVVLEIHPEKNAHA